MDKSTALQDSLATLIVKATTGIDAATNFLTAQIPDIIQQLLIWNLVSRLVTAGICLMVIVVVASVLIYGVKNKLMFDEWGDATPYLLCSGVLGGLVSIFASLIGIASVFSALQIWLAPKVRLSEYAVQLVR